MSKMAGLRTPLRRLAGLRVAPRVAGPMLQRAAPVSTQMAKPQMMCYQCEQTTGGKGCTTVGVCTKTPQLAGLQDLQMLYNLRLCQLSHTLGSDSPFSADVRKMVLGSTFATLTNVNFDDSRFRASLAEAAGLAKSMEGFIEEKMGKAALPQALPGLPSELPMDKTELLLAAGPAGLLARSEIVQDEDLFGVVEMGVYGFKGICAYFHHAEHLGVGEAPYTEAERTEVYDELFRIGSYLASAGSSTPADAGEALNQALGECLALGALNLKVMQMLDAAHNTALGSPSPHEVSTEPGGNPAILVSGHDLGVLHDLLEQTKGKGVDVYTHGEMLPAHGYPKLRAHDHLRGHFGTHWGNQLHEFRHFPGSIIMTSNCLRPPTRKYKDRIWTSGPVGFESIPVVEGADYGPVIEKALSLPAFDGKANSQALRGSSQRDKMLVGFGHEAVLGVADKVVGAIKAGDLKHIFVIGGCDGTESSRSYFSDLAADTPPDSIILTLGCGKFRLNHMDHGTLGGLPRLLDMGQCNDAYSAVVVAVKLAEALGCTVQDLPLHFAVSWFEQKAVAVLLTLLHLELKNIRIGPAVPAFLTPKVVGILNAKFGLNGIDAAHEDEDLEKMLRGE